ncbi:hypothetical protein SDC9_07935 [bioreactor metagenome]|uniref:Band 7 domain-containing protein n=1 Tax=bioreactor metagenome TaxID=1076179 RepID=A0A644T8U4_9ZZZZ|nr:SPFH domain-containing protein [Candidatus Elulimicrobiales bacterium]MEA4968293.1 SPFH domain-containing protein [Bacteroidaceae bacterium]
MEKNFDGFKMGGIAMLFIDLLILGFFFLIALMGGWFLLFVLVTFIVMFSWKGFTLNEPNEARVLTFFGKYVGTIKDTGFFWVNPFLSKKKLTLRARNLDIEPIKVNDKSGNPIMIGSVVVWKVSDTYKAIFEIDSASNTVMVSSGNPKDGSVPSFGIDRMKAYEHFVRVQGNAALRRVAGMYPYDQSEEKDLEGLTLRSDGEEINKILEKELGERLTIAGIEIVEARINYLAYAPEIAAVMLRRQQADAIIAAREKIVEGAVGMVKMALEKIDADKTVTLSEEKKAEIVGNLMVVLCSDESAQPVVNV